MNIPYLTLFNRVTTVPLQVPGDTDLSDERYTLIEYLLLLSNDIDPYSR